MERASTKSAVRSYVIGEQALALSERYFGRAYSWLVTYCGENPDYDGQLAVFDLYYDPDPYRALSVEQLVSVLNASPKVIRALRANAQPILMPMDTAPQDAKAIQVPPEERRRRIEAIRNDAEFRARVGQALAQRFADREPSPQLNSASTTDSPALLTKCSWSGFMVQIGPARRRLRPNSPMNA